MPNYFYTDTNGQRQGPINDQQLRELAAQKRIQPDTPLETDTGHRGVARQIPGLFTLIQTGQTGPPFTVKKWFCTNCGKPISEHAAACMSCGASPIGHKKFCRHCGIQRNPRQSICVSCGDKKHCRYCHAELNSEQIICTKCGRTVDHTGPDSSNINDTIKSLNTNFRTYWICAVIGFPSVIFPSLISLLIPPLVPFALFVKYLVLIVTLTFACKLIYPAWKIIPQDIVRTTPWKAIIFCLIPLYNFFWIFVAFKGLSEDMNKTLERYGIQCKVKEGLGAVYCILSLVCFIPIVGSLIYIIYAIVSIIFLNSIKNGAIILLERNR